MPKIRFTYGRDVARFGARPVEVADVTARRLLADRRAELACAGCPLAACALCTEPEPEPEPEQ